MPRNVIEAFGLSDAGSVRQFNEDRVVVDTALGVVALADGMGGHRAGDVAAHLAADIVWNALRTRLAQTSDGQHSLLLAVNESINRANTAIHEASRAPGARQGMGTTIAVAAFAEDAVVIGHVGDSRIYRLRDDQLTLLTRDDSLVREAVAEGLIDSAEAADSHNRSLVTQALGATATVEPGVHSLEVRADDVYLLCSDGLSDLVAHEDVELIVNTLKPNLALAARTLVETAKDHGGYDNVSVVLARRAAPAAPAPRGWLSRTLAALFGRR